MWNLFSGKSRLVDSERALPGRAVRPFEVPAEHFVNGNSLTDVPDGHEVIYAGLGCFWGAERLFWTLPGVWSTAVGYQGGFTPHPTYQEVCSGQTGHTEAVRVVFDPVVLSHNALLKSFWEGHDPTQGMRQGNDEGTQYRSALYSTTPEQAQAALRTRDLYEGALGRPITTEVSEAATFYYAEDYHQQYLAKNPGGYCGLGGTGVSCPIGVLENG